MFFYVLKINLVCKMNSMNKNKTPIQKGTISCEYSAPK